MVGERKGMLPSMLVLLGVLAVAGYQNRDKIAKSLEEMKSRTGPDGEPDPVANVLNSIGGLFGLDGDKAAGPNARGNVLTEGLDSLMDTFRGAGEAKAADSWVTMGVPTEGLTPEQVEKAIGGGNIEELSRRTGLSREQLLERLATAIPESVDRITPGGHMPASDEEVAQRLVGTA
jgi:uncharacterized protein YidB (DUF937 family)